MLLQEEQEIQRCKSCKSVFHKDCFSKLKECPCGTVFKEIDPTRSRAKLRLGNTGNETGSSSAKLFDVKSPVEFISSLFLMSRQEKIKEQKDGGNVILMGSLPSNYIWFVCITLNNVLSLYRVVNCIRYQTVDPFLMYKICDYQHLAQCTCNCYTMCNKKSELVELIQEVYVELTAIFAWMGNLSSIVLYNHSS